MAAIRADGGLGPWRLLESKLSSKRAMMGMVAYEDRVYSIGGAGSDAVEYATFNETGEMGSWLTAAELAAIETTKASAQPQPQLGGRVVKVMHAPPYVYLQLQVNGSSEPVWLAGPAGNYSPGEFVRFGGGAMMTNFFSKQLNIRFERVLFVSELHKAAP